ncbi:hypothetical protein Vadar_010424 [Vaccinium darrowii]|uniref:Uncharacterized protein n=1 Tax=Vaccinium darrowii TaxID=229202 RepID=A0ACB7ZJF2_9ERIC|nr:hypothetical protein Vadar_010424 [Vaccinium darrowii]
MATTNGAGGHTVVKIVRFMECHRNTAAIRGIRAIDGCLEFKKSGPSDTPEVMVCSTCGCDRHFHRKVEQLPGDGELPTEKTTPLNRHAAAAVGAPLPPRPPKRKTKAATPPPAAPKSNAGSEGFSAWRKVGEGNMPPKKRRLNMEEGESSAKPSTSA